MKILALDMATKTGWAYMKNGDIIESGVQDFTKGRGETNGLMFWRFRKWLAELGSSMNPDLIAYERAHFRGGPATEIGVGMQTRAQEAAAKLEIPCAPIHTGTLKKFATGKGNAGKEEMSAEAEKCIGRTPLDDNEADAVMIAVWASTQYDFDVIPDK